MTSSLMMLIADGGWQLCPTHWLLRLRLKSKARIKAYYIIAKCQTTWTMLRWLWYSSAAACWFPQKNKFTPSPILMPWILAQSHTASTHYLLTKLIEHCIDLVTSMHGIFWQLIYNHWNPLLWTDKNLSSSDSCQLPDNLHFMTTEVTAKAPFQIAKSCLGFNAKWLLALKRNRIISIGWLAS